MRPVFGKAPDGAPEKVRTEMAWGRKQTSIPLFRRGDNDIIESGIGIVLTFRPEIFFEGRREGSESDGEFGAYKRGKAWIWAFSRIRWPVPRLAGLEQILSRVV
jgi:hypothetical protein